MPVNVAYKLSTYDLKIETVVDTSDVISAVHSESASLVRGCFFLTVAVSSHDEVSVSVVHLSN